MAERDRNKGAHYQHGNYNARAGSQSYVGEHVWEPEGSNEAPSLPDKRDEDTNATGFLRIAVDSVRDEDSCDDLVACRSDTSTNDRCDVPVAFRSLLDADQEYNKTADCEQDAKVAKPQPELGLRLPGRRFLRASTHPYVARVSTDLLANDRSNDEAKELKPKLLRVEMELLAEKLGNLNSCENRSEEEHHCVCACWDHDTRVLGQSQRRDEFQGSDGGGVDAAELEVRLFEGCKPRNGMLSVVVTDEARFGTEQSVEY